MNENRTVSNSGTNLTQARSPAVLGFDLPPLPFDPIAARDFIYTERNVVGRHSPLGRYYSKLGEQTENLLKAETQEQADLLAVQMIETHKDILNLKRVRVAAVSKGDV